MTKKFEFEGRHIEIRVADMGGLNRKVKAFYLDSNEEVNGYSYSVDLPTALDFSRQHGSAIDHLIELAQADVENKAWEKYIASHKA
jgi:hypothetical protein